MGVNGSAKGVPIEEPPLWLGSLLAGPPWGAYFPQGVCDDCEHFGRDRYLCPVDGALRCVGCYRDWFLRQPSTPVNPSEALRTDPVPSPWQPLAIS